MNKKISNFQIACLTFFLIRASIVGNSFNNFIILIKQDCWITPIISYFIGILFILLLNKIIIYNKNKNIFDKIKKLYKNKTIANIISIIIILIFFTLCLINYINLLNFIHSQFLTKTPIYIIAIAFALTFTYITSFNINIFLRTTVILFFISISLLIFSSLGLIPFFNILNIKPILQSNPQNYIISILNFFTFNILPIFMITFITNKSNNIYNIKKSLILIYIISSFSIFLVFFQTISTFGYNLLKLYEYPEFYVLKQISLSGFSNRIDGILMIQWICDYVVYICYSIYFFKSKIKFKRKYNNIIVNFLLLISVIFLSKYNVIIENCIFKYFFIPIIILSLLSIIPIYIKIKSKKNLT